MQYGGADRVLHNNTSREQENKTAKQRATTILQLLCNNSFVLVGPLSGFLVILTLAKLSHLAADSIYFLVLSLLAFSSLVEGGITYKLSAQSSRGEIATTVRMVVRNLQIFALAPPLFLIFMLSNETSRFESTAELISILLVAGFASITKVLGDSLRVIGMKSARRNTVDRASSLLSLVRVIFAYLFVNYFPFLYTYTALIFAELVLLSFLLREDVKLWSRSILSGGSVLKVHINTAYLIANIGYILGFNVDRLISFNNLDDQSYHTLIVVMSLLNMSVLPNKLLENLLTFPVDYSQATGPRAAPVYFSILGIILFCIGLFSFNDHLSSGEEIALVAISVIWVPITLYYNNLWASHLKNGGSINFAKITLFSGLVATIIALAFPELYEFGFPVGIFFYSVVNAMLVRLLRVR